MILLLLVFEGILRKAFPSISTAIFFLKDIICIWGFFFLSKIPLYNGSLFLKKIWGSLFLLFIPTLIVTTLYDPFLAVFGLKQYLLYIIVSILVSASFSYSENAFNELKKFIAFFSFLILPTTGVALIQSSLPPTHWLNLSVDGESLEAFAAAGKLRLSSTFSFTGQYGFFLNSAVVFYITSFFLRPVYARKQLNTIFYLSRPIIGIALLIGIFITGGRTAVLGCSVIAIVGGCLSMFFLPKYFTKIGIVFGVLIFLSIGALRIIKPSYFEVYDARSLATGSLSQNEDMKERVLVNFIGWIKYVTTDNIWYNVFGRGLGMMSNGSSRISSYAEYMVSKGAIPESDMEVVAWEGGIYLWLIFYGMRLYMLWFCFRIVKSMIRPELILAGSFFLGYIIVTGLAGALSKQVPIIIYWWLTIGLVMSLKYFDHYQHDDENKEILYGK